MFDPVSLSMIAHPNEYGPVLQLRIVKEYTWSPFVTLNDALASIFKFRELSDKNRHSVSMFSFSFCLDHTLLFEASTNVKVSITTFLTKKNSFCAWSKEKC